MAKSRALKLIVSLLFSARNNVDISSSSDSKSVPSHTFGESDSGTMKSRRSDHSKDLKKIIQELEESNCFTFVEIELISTNR